jgi:hypothetical protein
MGAGSRRYLKDGPGKTNKTCANLRQVKVSLGLRRSQFAQGCERHRIYSDEQDLSGVLKADGPLGWTGIGAAGRTRRTGGDG